MLMSPQAPPHPLNLATVTSEFEGPPVSTKPSWIAGRYEPLETLRHEGERRVLRVFDHLFQQEVILKAVEGEPGSPSVRALYEEYTLLTSLDSPAVARPFACAVWKEPHDKRRHSLFYLTQERLEGPSLFQLRMEREQLTHPRMEPALLLACLVQTLRLLATLHTQGYFGLDLKPEHLLLTPRGWCLIDLEPEEARRAWESGDISGVARYLAPELLEGERPTPQSDLFSLGCLLLEAVGLTLPGEGTTARALARSVRESAPPQLPEWLVQQAPSLATCLMALVQTKQELRPRTAEAALRLLDIPPEPLSLPSTPLVGRKNLLDEAMTHLESWREHTQGGSLYVSGPPGSGRRSFLRALEVQAALAGFLTLRLEGSQDAERPLGIVQRLQNGLQHLLEVSSSQQPISTVELLNRLEPVEAEERIQLSLQRLCQTTRRLKHLIRAPVVVMMEALDTCDELSQQLFRQLPAGAEDVGLIWVASGPLQLRSARMELLELPPLDHAQARALAEGCLGVGSVSPEQLDRLLGVVGGFPGPLREGLRLLRDQPTLLQTPLMELDSSWLQRSQIQHLPESLRGLAAVASCFRDPFTLRALELMRLPSLTHFPPTEQLATRLSLLLEQGLIIPVRAGEPTSEVRYRFASGLLRVALEETLDPVVRRQVHQRLAQLLERRTGGISAPPLVLVHHLLEAGLMDRARPVLYHALETLGHEGKRLELLEALNLLIPLEQEDPAAVLELWLQRGELRLELGQIQEALQDFEQARTRATDAGARARCLAGEARCLGAQPRGSVSLVQVQALWQQALSLGASARLKEELRVQWWQRLASLHLRHQQFEAAAQALEQARKLERQPRARAALQGVRLEAWLALAQETPAASLEPLLPRLQTAIHDAKAQGMTRLEHNLRQTHTELLNRMGKSSEALVELEHLIRLTQERFDVSSEASATYNLGRLLCAAARWSEARALFERATLLHERLGDRVEQARCLISQAEILLEEDRGLQEAARLLQNARTLLQEHTLPVELTRSLETLEARLELRTGSSTDHLEERMELLERLRAAGQLQDAFTLLLEQLEQLLRQDRLDEAGRFVGFGMVWPLTELTPASVTRFHRLASQLHHRLASPSSPNVALPELNTLAWLERFDTLLESVEEPQQLAARLARLLSQLVSGEALVMLYLPSGVQLVGEHELSMEKARRLSSSLLGRLQETGEPVKVRDLLVEASRGTVTHRAWEHRCVVCWPIRQQGLLLGALYVGHREPDALMGDQILTLIERVAGMSARLLQSQQQVEVAAVSQEGDLGVIGTSPAVQKLRLAMARVLRSRDSYQTVLVTGERGVGKSSIVKYLAAYGRRKGLWRDLHLVGVADDLVLSELFGVKAKAYTGVDEKKGFVEICRGGTLFLDEIGEISPRVQATLLQFVQDRMGYMLGSTEPIYSDADLFVATNVDLDKRCRDGLFRHDLRDRLWKNRIYVPSLRERGRADIQLLALDALEKVFKSEGLERSPRLESHFTPAALHFLYTYSWPGNVRELGDTLASKIIAELLCDGKRRVDVRDLEGQIFGDQAPRLDDGVVFRPATACVPPPVWNWERFSQWIEDIKVGYVNQALEVYGNYAQAAEALKVQRGTLYRYVPKKGKS